MSKDANEIFINNTLEVIDPLVQLIGKENVDELQKGIVQLILDRVKSDIKAYDYYLFYPENYQSTIDDAFEKTKKKISKMYNDAMLESATEAVERFKDIATASLNDSVGLKLRSCHKCNYHDGNRCKFYDMYYWKAHDTLCAEEGFVNYIEKEEEKKDKGIKFYEYKY